MEKSYIDVSITQANHGLSGGIVRVPTTAPGRYRRRRRGIRSVVNHCDPCFPLLICNRQQRPVTTDGHLYVGGRTCPGRSWRPYK
jgi:hypothetical protein